MKTTLEQRQSHKEKRRFRRLASLATKLRLKCARSKRSLQLIDEVLFKATRNGTIAQYLDAIRRAN